MRTNRLLGLGAAMAALFVMVGCVPLPEAPSSAAVPPAADTPVPVSVPVPVPVPAPAPRAPRDQPPATAPVDSTPSAEAERVLASIPEPLSAARQVPPLARGTPARSRPVAAPGAAYDTLRSERKPMPAPEAAYDTLRAERQAGENGGARVPVPSPTQPLGSISAGTLTMPDSIGAPPGTTPTVTAPPVATPPPSEPAGTPARAPQTPATGASGDCWRLQIAAPAEKPKAVSRRDAAQSLLVVPMVIEFEKGLYKVRTRDCMSHETAQALKARAADSGFPGVFIVNSKNPAAPPHKSARGAPRKIVRR